jgi:anti-anti-sigma factor
VLSNEFDVELRMVGDAAIIVLRGDVNAAGEEAIREAYATATADDARHILMDLAEADYINTSGIAVLIAIVMEAQRADQKILVYGVSSHYRKIFELVRLPMYVQMYDTEAEALSSVGIDPETV